MRRGLGWRRLSLRARLTWAAALVLAVALVAGALALSAVLQAGRVRVLDDLATARVAVVADLVAADRVPDALPVVEPGEVAQVLDAAGGVLATSSNASRTLPLLSLDELTALRAAAGEGVAVATSAGGAYQSSARVAVRAATWRGEDVTVVVGLPLGEVQGLLRALRLALLTVVPLLTALCAAAVWVVLGRALRPVEQLRAAAAGVAASGGPGALPVPAADDELAALARTLNEMLDRLDAAAARQRTFVADAAHELRSPLAALRVTLDVARLHPEAQDPAELADEISAEVSRMSTLVDDLLLLARLGAAPGRRGPVDLRAVAEEVAAGVAGGRVPVEVVGTGQVSGDRDRTARVLCNLVENGVRHAATRVRVTVSDGPAGAQVVVEDDGAGVAPADRERVFERFVRLDEARQREAGGSGLGLAIARELAREQGGDVLLGDGALGGLAARLMLPAGAATDPRPHPDGRSAAHELGRPT